MAHREQREFCERVKRRWLHLFDHRNVLDVGSLNVNGTNRDLFHGGSYTGIDVIAGPGVDVVCPVHMYRGGPFNTIISTEALEHDRYAEQSLCRMIDLLTPDGLLLLTCATVGRAEHGTSSHEPTASPGTNDFYANIPPEMIQSVMSRSFRCWSVEVCHGDMYAWGLDRTMKPAETLNDLYEQSCMTSSEISEHLPRLRELAEQVDSITEFGIGPGRSTSAFLAGRPRQWTGYDIDPYVPGRAVVKFADPGTVARLHFTDTATCDPIEPTDLLFVDSLHTAAHVAAELFRHSRRVRKFIVFHDTQPPWGDAVRQGIEKWRESPDAARWRLIEDLDNSHGLQVWEADENPSREQKHHLLISGYGRAGTTFLMQLLTRCGLDTGFANIRDNYHEHCNAGLEWGLHEPTWPYVVKSPFLCDRLDEMIDSRQIVVDHLFVPVRELTEAAESRRRHGNREGGLWDSDGPDQEAVLAVKLNKLLVSAARRDIPVTLLAFPRLVRDREYLWSKLRGVIPLASTFDAAFAELADTSLVHVT